MTPTPSASTTTPRPRCPQCGMILSPGARPGGPCTGCLLSIALDAGPASSDPSPADLARLFPDLEFLGGLGRGGMGIVHEVRRRGERRTMALKILAPDLEADPAIVERLRREGAVLSRLDHPNIVGLHEAGDVGGLGYLLMERVDGTDLRTLLRRGDLDPRQVLSIVPQICDALQYAHEAGVVHRDLKPENILVDGRGRVRIADFGLAKILGGGGRGATLTHLTAAGDRMGTPYYMAPEQVDGSSVDRRADVYALGVILYEMLTGDLPLGRFEPPSRRSPLGQGVDPIVYKALSADPSARYATAADVAHALAALAPADDRRGTADRAVAPAEPAARSEGTWPVRVTWTGGTPFGANMLGAACTAVALTALLFIGSQRYARMQMAVFEDLEVALPVGTRHLIETPTSWAFFAAVVTIAGLVAKDRTMRPRFAIALDGAAILASLVLAAITFTSLVLPLMVLTSPLE